MENLLFPFADILRFSKFLFMCSLLNAMVYFALSTYNQSVAQQLRLLLCLNLVIFAVFFFIGNGGIGKDWSLMTPPLLNALFWIIVLGPKLPPRKKNRRRVAPVKKRSFNFPGTQTPRPA
jgi:hypothetical protein